MSDTIRTKLMPRDVGEIGSSAARSFVDVDVDVTVTVGTVFVVVFVFVLSFFSFSYSFSFSFFSVCASGSKKEKVWMQLLQSFWIFTGVVESLLLLLFEGMGAAAADSIGDISGADSCACSQDSVNRDCDCICIWGNVSSTAGTTTTAVCGSDINFGTEQRTNGATKQHNKERRK
jgi:hypothetical protein